MKFTNPALRIATFADVDTIVHLLNSAYRGESSKFGWTTEAHLIGGNVRANAQQVTEVIIMNNSIMLVYTDAAGLIIGCVNLQIHTTGIYLGMFSVQPNLQGAGIGKTLLKAAEEFALANTVNRIYMTVIDARTELIDWYKRNGYKDTGERKIFEEDGITGNHLQPLQFAYLEKFL